MYSELIIRPAALAEQIIYPDAARKLAAAACDGVPVPPLLFHRQADGNPMQGLHDQDRPDDPESGIGLPPVAIFDGGKGFIRLYTLGAPGRELMQEVAAPLAMAIAKYVGGPFGFEMKEGNCRLRPSDDPVLYKIRRLVIAKKEKHIGRYIGATPFSVEADLRKAVFRGLLSQAKWLDENSSQDAVSTTRARHHLQQMVPDIQSLGFNVADGHPLPIKIVDGVYAAGYADLFFSMHIDLSGPWLAGLLRSRGYGSIRRAVFSKAGKT